MYLLKIAHAKGPHPLTIGFFFGSLAGLGHGRKTVIDHRNLVEMRYGGTLQSATEVQFVIV